jgi:type VI secretion system protein ImpB
MPREESTQQKLSRVRTPRVHITYEVETGGAIQMVELPFVVAVFGDFSGEPDEPLPKVKERKLIEIDRDNFDKVLAGMKPRIAFTVEDTLAGDGSSTNVELRFKSLDDFHPDNVVKQVETLRKLVEARKRLSDLVSKMDGNDRLEDLLTEVINNSDSQKQLSTSLGIGSANGSKAGEEK